MNTLGSEMLKLLRESVLVQAVTALLVIAAVIYQIITSNTVNDTLLTILYLVLGFYFGSKVQHQIESK